MGETAEQPESLPLIVYTAAFGPRGDPILPPALFRDAEYVVFTDQPDVPYGWAKRNPVWTHVEPRRSARYHKIRSTLLFPGRTTLWLDANISLRNEPALLLRHLTQALAVHAHRERDCVYAEYRACLKFNKDDPEVMARQIQRYRHHGYKESAGLVETGVLLRKDTPELRAFEAMWWNELSTGSSRDQLSFNWAAHQIGFKYSLFPGTVYTSPYFKYTPHSAGRTRSWR